MLVLPLTPEPSERFDPLRRHWMETGLDPLTVIENDTGEVLAQTVWELGTREVIVAAAQGSRRMPRKTVFAGAVARSDDGDE